jgi:hypothetical protein
MSPDRNSKKTAHPPGQSKSCFSLTDGRVLFALGENQISENYGSMNVPLFCTNDTLPLAGGAPKKANSCALPPHISATQ